jgi:hypothetical protein
MGRSQAVIETDRADGGGEYVRGEVIAVGGVGKSRALHLRSIVSLLEATPLNFRYIT